MGYSRSLRALPLERRRQHPGNQGGLGADINLRHRTLQLRANRVNGEFVLGGDLRRPKTSRHSFDDPRFGGGQGPQCDDRERGSLAATRRCRRVRCEALGPWESVSSQRGASRGVRSFVSPSMRGQQSVIGAIGSRSRYDRITQMVHVAATLAFGHGLSFAHDRLDRPIPMSCNSSDRHRPTRLGILHVLGLPTVSWTRESCADSGAVDLRWARDSVLEEYGEAMSVD